MMKNTVISKLSFMFCFLFLSLSLSADVIGFPLSVNWLNPMNGNQPENFLDGRTYIYLDNESNLNINLSVTTTDNNLDPYDELHISYDFGALENGSIRVLEEDLVEIEHGIYEATYAVSLNFKPDCNSDDDGRIPIEVSLLLTSPKEGTNILEEYPLALNEGLFNPALYENLSPGQTAVDKVLLCWGVSPPSSMASLNSTTNNASKDHSSENTFNEKTTETSLVYPNPFSNEIQINCYLNSSSKVTIQFFNLNGKRILHQGFPELNPGTHTLKIKAVENIPAGVYIIHLSHSGKTELSKAVKLKAHQ